MLRRLRILMGVDPSPKTLIDSSRVRSEPTTIVTEVVQEIAVYIHRFHNLDLFQQGWYQIKVSMRREGDDQGEPAFPSRVIQHEAPDSVSGDNVAVWKINDADHSFYTRPFRIKFARQDVFLSVMVSFNLPVKGELASAVLMKFELLYAPLLDTFDEVQDTLDNFSASVHEIRVPSTALLGLHSYCPLHFDSFHTVLVDLTVHIVLLKAATSSSSSVQTANSKCHPLRKCHQNSGASNIQKLAVYNSGFTYEDIVLWKALCDARTIIIKELQKLSRAINKKIEIDSTESMTILSVSRKLDDLWVEDKAFRNASRVEHGSRFEISADPLSGISEQKCHIMDAGAQIWSSSFNEEIWEGFQILGSQLSANWNAFLRFHRENSIAITEHLRRTWADDRTTEWSLWMVHSKIGLTRQISKYSTHGSLAGKTLMKKSTDDPAAVAAARANLHRKCIEQLRINGRYLQDLQIFGNIVQVPVIYVEHLPIPCKKSTGNNDDLSLGNSGSLAQVEASIGQGRSKGSLRVVVFVHGFQGHHLDLRLVRNQWLLIDPGVECLMSRDNENKTSSDFRELGKRLAEEVDRFLKEKFSSSKVSSKRNFKLSFVGHSIGNIIIRSALADAAMKPYLNNLQTFLSISGPHLGYLYSSNTLFNSGLWLFKKLKGSPCMHQLTFTDEPDIRNSFLFKLSQEKTLEHFQNIILVSSPQDRYVPYHSARIEMCQGANKDSRKGTIYAIMLKNCLDQMLVPASCDRTLLRADVNFDTFPQAGTLNNFIGRAAHIEFLESDLFARFLMWSFPKLFL